MLGFHKYHIAISVAEPDIAYALELAATFKDGGIKYYFYKEHPEDAGLPLIQLVYRIYGIQSCIVVILHSGSHNQHWGNIERQVAEAKRKRTVLVKLDEALLEGYYANRVYLKWDDGLPQIVDALKKMTKWCRILPVIINGFLITSLLLLGLWFLLKPKPCKCCPEKRVLITMLGQDKTGVDSFEISSTEITVAQLSEYCSSHGKPMPPQPQHQDKDNCPAVNVSPELAIAYARWKGGRLPTSAEWEYAARANEHTNYSGSNQAGEVAVYNRDKFSRTGTKRPNAFCICDMTGNVAEWCTYMPFILPNDSIPVRGGAYNSSIDNLKISSITYLPIDTAVSWVGFRVVWDKK